MDKRVNIKYSGYIQIFWKRKRKKKSTLLLLTMWKDFLKRYFGTVLVSSISIYLIEISENETYCHFRNGACYLVSAEKKQQFSDISDYSYVLSMLYLFTLCLIESETISWQLQHSQCDTFRLWHNGHDNEFAIDCMSSIYDRD
jgi:hypothetical protein